VVVLELVARVQLQIVNEGVHLLGRVEHLPQRDQGALAVDELVYQQRQLRDFDKPRSLYYISSVNDYIWVESGPDVLELLDLILSDLVVDLLVRVREALDDDGQEQIQLNIGHKQGERDEVESSVGSPAAYCLHIVGHIVTVGGVVIACGGYGVREHAVIHKVLPVVP
jgi:hypothetical protein